MVETEHEMKLESLKNGEYTELEWDKPCPTCGEETHKLMWNKYKYRFYCTDCRCTGWSNELQLPSMCVDTDIIKDMSISIMNKRLAEDGLIETNHSIKTAAVLQVEWEWEENKDKALSNATKRNAEVDLRLSGDEEYTVRMNQLTALKHEIQSDQIELDFQKREFQRYIKEE